MAIALVGGGVCAAGGYLFDGLVPVKLPGGCGARKFLALSQYAMIAGFAVSVIHAVAISAFANLAIVAMIPLCLIGAYVAKQAVLLTTLTEKTKLLEKVNASYKKSVEMYAKLSKEREKAIKALLAKLKEAGVAIGDLGKGVGNIVDLVKNADAENKELNDNIQGLDGENDETKAHLNRYDKLNKKFKGYLDQYEKLGGK